MVCLWKSLAFLCFSVLPLLIYFNVDPDPDPGSQSGADPDSDPVQTLPAHKVGFWHTFYVRNMSKILPAWVQKQFWKAGWKSGLCVNFGQFSWSWLRIRIPNTGPDPDQCRSWFFCIGITIIIQKNFFSRTVLESVDALLSHIGGTKGRGSNYLRYLLKLERFFFIVMDMDKANTEHEAIDPEQGFKETVPRDFLLQAFFMDNLPLVSWAVLRIRIRDLGSGVGCFFTPGSGIGFFRIPDPGSQDHIFKSFLTIF